MKRLEERIRQQAIRWAGQGRLIDAAHAWKLAQKIEQGRIATANMEKEGE